MSLRPLARFSGSRVSETERVRARRSQMVPKTSSFPRANTTPWSAAFQPLNEELLNSMNGFGWQPTYPAGAGLLMLPIDHLLHSGHLTTVDRSTGPDLGSDHLPLIVTVADSAEVAAGAGR